MKAFITGTAGFIGYHVTKRLLAEGWDVVALDCINDYYDPRVKFARLRNLGLDVENEKLETEHLKFYRENLQNKEILQQIFDNNNFNVVINLAAQAGVRYQFENAYSYVDSNMAGFVTLMETVRNHPVDHVIYASSSSVYGMNEATVFKETDAIDHPASLYAASKRANELIAHSYSNLYNIPTTGLRFFTVYGPWGRPDMFMYKLAESIVNGVPLTMYQKNGKSLWRDYTFVTDIVEGIFRLIPHTPTSGNLSYPNSSTAPYAIYNIGHGDPIENAAVIAFMEEFFGKKGNIIYAEAPPTEVFRNSASTELLEKAIGYKPVVSVKEGVIQLAEWYKEYQESLK